MIRPEGYCRRSGRRPSRSPSPGQRPGERENDDFFPAQRANGSPRGKANFWPVGPIAQQKNGGRSFPQGVALGWANGWPFGPKSIVFSKIEHSGTLFPDDPYFLYWIKLKTS